MTTQKNYWKKGVRDLRKVFALRGDENRSSETGLRISTWEEQQNDRVQ